MSELVKGFNINELHQKAQNQWLRPAEVYFLLQNYEKQHITQEAPKNPPSGSLFFFNRRVLRFFRKDGHAWRKRIDGRLAGESHERLKVGNVDALNCYYAHGEHNPNFQRRCYWMLDPARDGIVFVHYRDVTEVRLNAGSVLSFQTKSISALSQSVLVHNDSCPLEQYWNSLAPGGSALEVSSNIVPEISDKMVATHETKQLGTSLEQDIHSLQSYAEQSRMGNYDDSMHFSRVVASYNQNEEPQEIGVLRYEKDEEKNDSTKQNDLNSTGLPQYAGDAENLHGTETAMESWKSILELSSDLIAVDSQEKASEKSNLEGVPNFGSTLDCKSGFYPTEIASAGNDRLISSVEKPKSPPNSVAQPETQASHWLNDSVNGRDNMAYYAMSGESLTQQFPAASPFVLDSDGPIHLPNELFQDIKRSTVSTYSSGVSAQEENSSMVGLRKADGMNWMETGPKNFDTNNKSPYDYYEMWFDHESGLLPTDSSLTIAQVQKFRICEVSPEWAYCHEGTKILITGDFLCDPSECSWACMFGDIEVPVEIIQQGVLRCHAPHHSPGKVTLCITAGNRESCSEIREFDFLLNPEAATFDITTNNSQKDASATTTKEELIFLARFVEVLLRGFDSMSLQKENFAGSEIQVFRKWKTADSPWGQIIGELLIGSGRELHTMDWILQEILKDKLHQWSSSKHTESGAVTCSSLSKQEQGMIHMIASLGYEWALIPILSSGVGVNFRDVNGWTALHWAARFGREKMVAALIAVGASAGAVTDPSPQEPSGKTPASVAALSGHKGLAGYLSEEALKGHLSSLTLEESEISKGSAAVEAERVVESIYNQSAQISISAIDDQLSLTDSLAAVRNAAQAATRIQAAFRAHSFRKRQERAASSCDEFGITTDGIFALLKFQRPVRNLSKHRLNKAALSIQKNYRMWKRRKEFLNLRRNVVSIQAHVRGHQVRKKYKELLWTVGVIEKAILRWRRRGDGLRGFRAEPQLLDESEEDDILKVFRKHKVYDAIDQALSRVLSMVESPVARQQYRRMLECYRIAKANLTNNCSEAAQSS